MAFQLDQAGLATSGATKAQTDTGESLFLTQELESLLPGVFQRKRPPLSAELHIPMATGHPEFAQSTGYVEEDAGVLWSAIAGPTQDLNRASINRKKFTDPVRNFGAAFGWTIFEIGAAQQQGIRLDMQYAAAVELGWRTLKNDLAWLGDRNLDIAGFLTNDQIPFEDTTVPFTSASTAADIAEVAISAIDDVADQSNDAHQTTRVLMAATKLRYISRTRMGTVDNITVLQYIKDNRPGVEIFGVRELDSVAIPYGTTTTTENLMIAGEFDPMNFGQAVPMNFKMLGLYQSGPLGWLVPCIGRIGSVQVQRPKAFKFFRGL